MWLPKVHRLEMFIVVLERIMQQVIQHRVRYMCHNTANGKAMRFGCVLFCCYIIFSVPTGLLLPDPRHPHQCPQHLHHLLLKLAQQAKLPKPGLAWELRCRTRFCIDHFKSLAQLQLKLLEHASPLPLPAHHSSSSGLDGQIS